MSARVSEIQRSELWKKEREKERASEMNWTKRDERSVGREKRRKSEGRGVWRNERSSNANIRGDRDWNNPPIRIVDVNGIMQIRAVGARTEPGTDWQLPHRSLNSIHRVVLWIVNRPSTPPPTPSTVKLRLRRGKEWDPRRKEDVIVEIGNDSTRMRR